LFVNLHDVVLSPDDSKLYVANVNNNAVKVLNPQSLMTLYKFSTTRSKRST
jgi:DNA-binding beta-propeller fold protein YncE